MEWRMDGARQCKLIVARSPPSPAPSPAPPPPPPPLALSTLLEVIYLGVVPVNTHAHWTIVNRDSRHYHQATGSDLTNSPPTVVEMMQITID